MKKIMLFIFMLLTVVLFSTKTTVVKADDDRYVTITLHSGDEGYFGTPDVKTKESKQFKGDAFSDRTEPTAIDEKNIFLGWATTPDSEFPNVDVNSTPVNMIGTDLYAVWSADCYINYLPGSGYIETPDGNMPMVRMKYVCGSNFIKLIPKHNDGNIYTFENWYTSTQASDATRITESSVVDKPDLDVHGKWTFNIDNIEEITVDHVYDLDLTGPGKFYKFTPSETKVYEMYAKDVVATESMNTPKIQLFNLDGKVLRTDKGPVDGKNTNLIYTLQKGETYVIQFAEQGGNNIKFKAALREANYHTVTFHIDSKYKGRAYFGNDENQLTLQVPFTAGEDISYYTETLVNFKNSNELFFVGWKLDPDEEYDSEEKIVVDDDIDVYADIIEIGVIKLDANGGYFTRPADATSIDYVYPKGTVFYPPLNPHNDNNEVSFAGWSRNKNAVVPDEDILELVTLNDELPDTLYAVYTDKILETWIANGGFLLNNPDVTTYSSSKGLGHIFYGLSLYHSDSRMRALGWVDQLGELIPYTSEAYPFYNNKGDTTYTAVWGRQIRIDANGGIFPLLDTETLVGIFEYDNPFTFEKIKSQIGEPVPDNASMYLAGWATTPDASEPDLIEGVSSIKDVDTIYAVWKDDTYSFKEGKDSNWTLNNKEGFTFIIKRLHNDSETYQSFTYIMIDGKVVPTKNYTRKEGSLILTLKPEYLNTLSVGKHDVKFRFAGNVELDTTLTINKQSEDKKDEDKTDGNQKEQSEKKSKKSNNPNTGDNITKYFILLGISIVCIIGMVVYIKKRK